MSTQYVSIAAASADMPKPVKVLICTSIATFIISLLLFIANMYILSEIQKIQHICTH